jgi:hypothetical protein
MASSVAGALLTLDDDSLRNVTSRLPLVALSRLSSTCAEFKRLFPEELRSASLDRAPERMELKCALSFARLTEPAKGAGCKHHARCNFDMLKEYSRKGPATCPVGDGSCGSIVSANIVRDEILQSFIESKPEDMNYVWFSADGAPRAWDVTGNNLIVLDDSDDE